MFRRRMMPPQGHIPKDGGGGKGDEMTGNITRRELRKWLRASNEGKDVETAVARLLAGGQK